MATPPRTKTSPFRQWAHQHKLLTLIGLPVLTASFLFGYYSPWGAMFIYWGMNSVFTRNVYLLEDIELDNHPILFWLIVALWIGSGIIYVLADFAPELMS